MYLLDTNTLIYFFKGLGNVASKLFEVPPKDVGIPSIAFYELQTGIRKSSSPEKRIAQLNDLVQLIDIVPFGATEATVAAQVRFELEQQGEPIDPYDLLIAGTALAGGFVLVTHNVKEFGKVKKLHTVDWY